MFRVSSTIFTFTYGEIVFAITLYFCLGSILLRISLISIPRVSYVLFNTEEILNGKLHFLCSVYYFGRCLMKLSTAVVRYTILSLFSKKESLQHISLDAEGKLNVHRAFRTSSEHHMFLCTFNLCFVSREIEKIDL